MIILTKEGLRRCREKILKAYYDPEKREEIEKIIKVLDIDLEEIKDYFLQEFLDIGRVKEEVGVFAETIACANCDVVFNNLLRELEQRGVKSGTKIKITIETFPLKN